MCFLCFLSCWWQIGSEIELKRVCVSHTFTNNWQSHDHRLPGLYLCRFVTQAIAHWRRTNPFHRKHFLLSYHKSSSVSSLVCSPGPLRTWRHFARESGWTYRRPGHASMFVFLFLIFAHTRRTYKCISSAGVLHNSNCRMGRTRHAATYYL